MTIEGQHRVIGGRNLAALAAIVAVMFIVAGCAKIHEPWMGADAETKKKWQSPPTEHESDQLRNRLMTSQTDR